MGLVTVLCMSSNTSKIFTFQDKIMTTGPYVSVNGNVTVNNGSLMCPAAGGRQVVVTRLVAGL